MAQEIPRGTVRESDGRMYWGSYNATLKTGKIVERAVWLLPEKFKARRVANRTCSKVARRNNAIVDNEAHKKRKVSVDKARVKASTLYPLRKLVASARQRAFKKGLAFDIELSDLVLPAMCPLLGIPLLKGAGKICAGSPSLDRINPALGYVKGNVWVISFKANAIKQNATVQELELLVNNLKSILDKGKNEKPHY